MARITDKPAPGQVTRRSFDESYRTVPNLGGLKVHSRNLDPFGYGGMARRTEVQRELFRDFDTPAQFRQRMALPDVRLSGTGKAKVAAAEAKQKSQRMGLMREAASKAASRVSSSKPGVNKPTPMKGTPKPTARPARGPAGPGGSMAASKASSTAKSRAAPNSAVRSGGPSRSGPGPAASRAAASRSTTSRSSGPSRGPTSAPSRTAPSKASSPGGSKSYGGPR